MYIYIYTHKYVSKHLRLKKQPWAVSSFRSMKAGLCVRRTVGTWASGNYMQESCEIDWAAVKEHPVEVI